MSVPPTALLLAALAAPAAPAGGEPARLTVRVVGLASSEGLVRLALHDSPDSWKRRAEPLHGASLPVEDLACTWELPDLPPGTYAVRAYHDLDGDGEIDTGALGRPTEPHGYSGQRRGRFGPPGWKKARFELGAEPLVIEVDLAGGSADDESEPEPDAEPEPEP
jgi:uncharacterized protein (DUF2141 family)